MSKTVIVWFRNDLRTHDHPALFTASQDYERVLPVFILNDQLLHGRHAGSNRNRFLLESLQDLRDSLRGLGADLVIRSGRPADILAELARETGAESVYCTADYTPYALQRDKAVKSALDSAGVAFRTFGGRLAVGNLDGLHTKTGKPHKVFTPFWKDWQTKPRRPVAPKPAAFSLPDSVSVGRLPALDSITTQTDLAEAPLPGGEAAARRRMHAWLKSGIHEYHDQHDSLSSDGTSRLSPYLHFGCVSVRELEDKLPDSEGARAYHRQLAWRDFYHYVLYKFPDNARQEFQERYRSLRWHQDKKSLQAWQDGSTGYPIVDACMRQLRTEGWMHNRGRLIVGSFLTKDLWLDWRLGEAYFMRMLIDGDQANNNGNWHWIASVGVDPAPVFRRIYNPALQGERYDASGEFIRKYVPELGKVPQKYLFEPWKMSGEQQREYSCIIGQDYPEPIVDHAVARQYALEQFRGAR